MKASSLVTTATAMVIATLGLAAGATTLWLNEFDGEVVICRESGQKSTTWGSKKIRANCGPGLFLSDGTDRTISFDTAVIEAAAPLVARLDLLEAELRQKNDQVTSLNQQIELLAAKVRRIENDVEN